MLKLLLVLITTVNGGGFGGFGVYMSRINYDNINSVLTRHGISALKSTQFGSGGFGYGIVGKIWIGGGGYGTSQRVSSDSADIVITEGAGFFEIGYSIFNSKRLIGALSLGFGGSGYRMSIYPVNKEISFDSLLTNPRRDAYVLISSSFSLSPSLNLLLKLANFVGLIARASYVIVPSTSWKFDDGDRVLNAPDFRSSHLNLSLNVVFGKF